MIEREKFDLSPFYLEWRPRTVRDLLENICQEEGHPENLANIARAYEHLCCIKNTENIHSGLLDVEACILETHKLVMGDRTGGQFTSRPRFSIFNGQLHWYPDSEDMYSAVQQIVDRHNWRISRSRQADIFHVCIRFPHLASIC